MNKKLDNSSPFVFDISDILQDGMPDTLHKTGPTPERIGVAMIAVPKGGEVTVTARVTPLGSGVMVDATMEADLEGECVRCLAPLTPHEKMDVTQVFSADESFITGDDPDGSEEDDTPMVQDEHIDLLQAFTDEFGLNLPFNPVCEDGCDFSEVPQADGISGEEERTDPRWAGLEKFL